jgi:hypothetical protein
MKNFILLTILIIPTIYFSAEEKILSDNKYADGIDIPESELDFNDIPSRFRAVHRWTAKPGNEEYIAAFPSFEQSFNAAINQIVYGTILLKPNAVEVRDIPESELDFNDIPSMFRAIHRWTAKPGNDRYIAAIPNFEQNFNQSINQTVYGAILFKSEAVEVRDIPLSELDPYTDIPSMIRAVGRWTAKPGNEKYIAAIPNFEQNFNQSINQTVIGAILIKGDKYSCQECANLSGGYAGEEFRVSNSCERTIKYTLVKGVSVRGIVTPIPISKTIGPNEIKRMGVTGNDFIIDETCRFVN